MYRRYGSISPYWGKRWGSQSIQLWQKSHWGGFRPLFQPDELPGTLQKFGFRSFAGCISLKRMNSPMALQLIRNDAFARCTMLSIDLHNDIVSVWPSVSLGALWIIWDKVLFLRRFGLGNSIVALGWSPRIGKHRLARWSKEYVGGKPEAQNWADAKVMQLSIVSVLREDAWTSQESSWCQVWPVWASLGSKGNCQGMTPFHILLCSTCTNLARFRFAILKYP